jgi:PEGA domain
MKSLRYGLGIVVAGVALAATPAFAQKPETGGGGGPASGAVDRASGGGSPSGGGAVDRSSSGGSTVSSSSDSSSGGGGSSFSSPSAGAASSPSISFGDRSTREFAPRHREGFSSGLSYSASDDGQKATPRSSGGSSSSGGGSSSGTAVTRGGGSSSGSSSSSGGSAATSSDSGGRSTTRTRTGPAPEASSNNNNSSGTREVPTWSRPRGDQPTTGTAKDRTVPPPDRNGGDHGRYGYYDPYGIYGNGGYYGNYYPYGLYGFGMGYGLYSGFGWAPYYGDPFGDPYGGGGYGGGGYGDAGYGDAGGSTTSYGRGEQGNLKLKVKPRAAKVYVDGYFVGTVDEFDGSFQKLALNTGRHKVEVKADGYETAEFDVLINPEQTVTFQGDLKRIQ